MSSFIIEVKFTINIKIQILFRFIVRKHSDKENLTDENDAAENDENKSGKNGASFNLMNK